MERILISESHDEDRRLLAGMVARLGYEMIAVMVPTPRQLTSADVLLVEPAEPVGAVVARASVIANPSLTLICASVHAAPSGLAELGVVFAACLLKPFTVEQLRDAIDTALLLRN